MSVWKNGSDKWGFARALFASVSINGVALFGLWMFGNWIIQSQDIVSLERWLLCILASAAIPALATLWFVLRGQKGLALCAVFAPVPMWVVFTLTLIAFDIAGIKI